jgi:hypothetical protein
VGCSRPHGLFLDATRVVRAVTYTHVRREHYELVERLVNEALDAAGSTWGRRFARQRSVRTA